MRYFVASAVRALRGMGWEAEMSAPRSGVDGTEIARQAAEDGVDVVFAIGGDGTIRGVASGLAGSRTALGILPAGTMNVFAFELGLRPFTWHRLWAMTANARKLAAARAYDVDVGRCGKEEFLLWAGIGLDALTIQQLEPRPRLDKFFTIPHYAAQVVWNAAQWHGLDMRFRADGEYFSGRFLLAVVANIRKYMGGYVTISPNARLDDGEMDLWLFSGEHIGDTARHLVDMATQRHPTSVKVQRVPFRHLESNPTPPTPSRWMATLPRFQARGDRRPAAACACSCGAVTGLHGPAAAGSGSPARLLKPLRLASLSRGPRRCKT
jgi:diacylglycerol kinase family enzyme